MKVKDIQLIPVCLLEENNVLDEASFYLYEGLIYSYSIDRVVNALKNVFNFHTVSKDELVPSSRNISNGEYPGSICVIPMEGGTCSISMIVPNNEYNTSKIDGYMAKYGYMRALNNKLGGDTVLLNYEKKFDNDATSLLPMIDKLYHICSKEVGDKACRIGLTPHQSINDKFPSNDERVYLSFNNYTDKSFKVAAVKIKMEKQQPLSREYVLLEINVQQLIEMGIKFYIDPRTQNAIYTHESIPAKFIKIIKTDKLN